MRESTIPYRARLTPATINKVKSCTAITRALGLQPTADAVINVAISARLRELRERAASRGIDVARVESEGRQRQEPAHGYVEAQLGLDGDI